MSVSLRILWVHCLGDKYRYNLSFFYPIDDHIFHLDIVINLCLFIENDVILFFFFFFFFFVDACNVARMIPLTSMSNLQK